MLPLYFHRRRRSCISFFFQYLSRLLLRSLIAVLIYNFEIIYLFTMNPFDSFTCILQIYIYRYYLMQRISDG